LHILGSDLQLNDFFSPNNREEQAKKTGKKQNPWHFPQSMYGKEKMWSSITKYIHRCLADGERDFSRTSNDEYEIDIFFCLVLWLVWGGHSLPSIVPHGPHHNM
jgi:hypothetical protein